MPRETAPIRIIPTKMWMGYCQANAGMDQADVGSKRSLEFVRDWLSEQSFRPAAALRALSGSLSPKRLVIVIVSTTRLRCGIGLARDRACHCQDSHCRGAPRRSHVSAQRPLFMRCSFVQTDQIDLNFRMIFKCPTVPRHFLCCYRYRACLRENRDSVGFSCFDFLGACPPEFCGLSAP